jgi:hypothetical protein
MRGREATRSAFVELFGQAGGERLPGNVGYSRTVSAVCAELMAMQQPLLFDYFNAWDAQPAAERKPYGVEQALIALGQWEGAWAVAQLHYAQYLKQEATKGIRLSKGHPLCNLALAGRAIGSASLTKHYALLSSAGDVYWERRLPSLRYGGLAPTLLEQFESREEHDSWREKIREELSSCDESVPLYLEAVLARRWFSKSYAKHIMSLAEVRGRRGIPFVEVLIDSVTNSKEASAVTSGARFEMATALLLSATPGFEVDSARKTSDEQIDFVVGYRVDPIAQIGLETGAGLVECKSSGDPVTARDLRDFGAKCLFHRVKFGILVARSGVTGAAKQSDAWQNAMLVRRRFQLDGLTLLLLTMRDLRGRSTGLRGVAQALAADHKSLTFGPLP